MTDRGRFPAPNLMANGRGLALVLMLVLAAAQSSAQNCRQALALGLDVSGSVDFGEYRLQLEGLATALEDREVQDVLLAYPSAPVSIAVYEWSSSSYQRLIVPWTTLNSPGTINGVAANLRRWQRSRVPHSTGLGAAMEFGAKLLSLRPNCERATLDISGDGKNNEWPRPVLVKNSGVLDRVTVNALVIARKPLVGAQASTVNNASPRGDAAGLMAYFEQRIIHGPGSFIEVALGFEDYARAMKRKLLRELAAMVIGALEMPATGPVRQQRY